MAEILTQKTVKTRKPHQCWGCTQTFPAGTEMRFVTAIDGHDFISTYWCKDCDEIMKTKEFREYYDYDDGIEFGEIKEFKKEIYPYENNS